MREHLPFHLSNVAEVPQPNLGAHALNRATKHLFILNLVLIT